MPKVRISLMTQSDTCTFIWSNCVHFYYFHFYFVSQVHKCVSDLNCILFGPVQWWMPACNKFA